MPANYDHIARIYDLLSRIIFGKSIFRAQVCLLKYIPAGSTILIVGGGTGWILEEISKIHSLGLDIDYVEVSAGMIDLSQKRNTKGNKVNFINQPIEEYIPTKEYDVIITPFIFDNFKADKIDIVFSKLDALLKVNGLWLYADFVYDKKKSSIWQKLLLKIMYFFFRVTTGIETQELISMDGYFADGYRVEYSIPHYSGFIQSIAYRKL